MIPEEVRRTIEQALKNYDAGWGHWVGVIEDIAAARAWLATQHEQWQPVSGIQITEDNGKAKLVVRKPGDDQSELVYLAEDRSSRRFRLPPDLRLCRKVTP